MSTTLVAIIAVVVVVCILLGMHFHKRYQRAVAARGPGSGRANARGTSTKQSGRIKAIKGQLPEMNRAYRGEADCTADDVEDLDAIMRQNSVTKAVDATLSKMRRITGSVKAVPEHKLSLSKHDSATAMDEDDLDLESGAMPMAANGRQRGSLVPFESSKQLMQPPAPPAALSAKAAAAIGAVSCSAEPADAASLAFEAADGGDDDEGEEEDDEKDDDDDGADTSEWWFYVAGGAMKGPYTPAQMKGFYESGVVGHHTRVRWLPVAYGTPSVHEQDVEETSELQELCGDGMPPFLDAVMEAPAAKAPKKRKTKAKPPPGASAFSFASSASVRTSAQARESEFRKWEAAQAAEVEAKMAAEAEAQVRREMEAEKTATTATAKAEAAVAQAQAVTTAAAGKGLLSGLVGRRPPAEESSGTASSQARAAAAAAALNDVDDDEEEEEAMGGAGGGDDDDETSEWWFYAAAGVMKGPFTPYQMRSFYEANVVTERTKVRWLPVSYGMPKLEEQDVDATSPLEMLCGDGTPPFDQAAKGKFDAAAPKAAAAAAPTLDLHAGRVPGPPSPATLKANVRSRVARARGSIETIKGGPVAMPPHEPEPPKPKPPEPLPFPLDSERSLDADSMRI